MISEKQIEWNNFSRIIAEEGIVLLRNNNDILPLDNEKVAVFGQAQFNSIGIGRIIDGLISGGVNIDKNLADIYKKWGNENVFETNHDWVGDVSKTEMFLSEKEILEAKLNGAEKAIMVIGRTSGENRDMKIVEGDYLLSQSEIDLLNKISAQFDKIIIILNIGCNIDLSFLDTYKIDGVIYTNIFGKHGVDALADILIGNVNPSGKITHTMARHYEDYSSSGHFGQLEGGLLQDYTEDIFVGYRWFDTFNKQSAVVFPFGYGLSYTKFSIEDISFKITDKIIVSAKVTNIGNLAGKEILQLYYSAPNYADGALLGKPKKEFCGFEKTKLLKPNESQILTIELNINDMASYDDIGVLGEKSCWVMEQGNYEIQLGTNSANVSTVGVYKEEKTRIVERCHTVVTTLTERLLADGSYEKLPVPEINENTWFSVTAMGETYIPLGDVLKHTGNTAKIKLQPGVGGGYRLELDKLASINDLVTLKVGGVEINNPKCLSENSVEIVLPQERCILEITAKIDLPNVKEIKLEKIDSTIFIKPNAENRIGAQSMYECSFCVNVRNYDDDGFGNSGAYVTNLFRSGMNYTYKLEVEKEGKYDISFKYAYSGENCNLNDIMTLAISNIVHPLGNIILQKTYNQDEKRIFKYTNKSTVFLPKGSIYLKLISEGQPFPDISEIVLTENSSAVLEENIISNNKNSVYSNPINAKLLKHDGSEKKGMQFKEVVDNPSLMDIFLAQLDNRELAMIVSGTSLNATPYGDVGCNVPSFSRGIPPAQTADGPTGLRQKGLTPTKYGSGLILSSTFNKEIYENYGKIMGEECNFYGIDLWLAPSINILRNPCGGRNLDYCSEDPYLCGIFASYQIKGIQSYGVGAVLKHYCVNNSEFERLKSNSRVSERAMREIYIKGFEIAVKYADPVAIMSSYNLANDVKVSETPVLITDIPRKEWNWDGVFITDWWNGADHITEIKAGHDLKMATGDIDGVTNALNSGELSREQVYVCAKRVLKMLIKLKAAMGRIDEL